MASEPSRETLTLALGKRKIAEEEEEEEEEDEEEEEREIRELEREVGDLGRRILDYRRTIPDRLLEALSASLVAQRPLLPPQSGSGSFPSDLSLAPDIGGNRTTDPSVLMIEHLKTGCLNCISRKSPTERSIYEV
ncbi:histone acetyltransferase KAT6B isoform X2 [Ananas comosus]|uniref:Histone acetyltransferase KAT6B isoform X2 n=1 Tax=Ananas comosus TaxID=4615 RepID=A0A6P5EMN1_ANACO|nr:histone acetyltransferase KAT6B isoform X2 [Ananas comosus]